MGERAARYVPFDVRALVDVAIDAAGANIALDDVQTFRGDREYLFRGDPRVSRIDSALEEPGVEAELEYDCC